MEGTGTRAARLKRRSSAFFTGKRTVSTIHDSELFLETLRTYPSASKCLELVLGISSGLHAIQESVRASSSLQFIRAHMLPFIGYLNQPEAKAICEGSLLQQVINTIVNPPTAWNAVVKHYVAGDFDQTGVEAFAWLCFEIVTHASADFGPISNQIESTLRESQFSGHTGSQVRELGYRIQKVLQTRALSGAIHTEDLDGPGGRHDNDFADFCRISIYPTKDELASTIQPFYHRTEVVARSAPAERTRTHRDNQFRLLREDMLAEIRGDIQTALAKRNLDDTHRY